MDTAFLDAPLADDPARYLPELCALPHGTRIGAYRIEGTQAFFPNARKAGS